MEQDENTGELREIAEELAEFCEKVIEDFLNLPDEVDDYRWADDGGPIWD